MSTDVVAGEEGGEGRRGVVFESAVRAELAEEQAEEAVLCKRMWGLRGWG